MLSTTAVRGLPPAGRFAFLAALCSSFGQTFYIGLFGADFRAEFGLSESALGTLYGSATLVSGLSMFWLGAIADHLSLRRAIGLTMILLAIGAALVGLAHGALGLFFGLFLLRLSGQGLAGHLAVVAAGRFAVARRGRAIAMATYGFILGEALLPPAVATAMGWIDWREIWWCAAGIVALLALPALLGLAGPLSGRAAAQAAESPQVDASVQSRRALLGNTAFLRVLGIALVSPFVVTALFLHQGTLAERLGWSMSAVASGFVLFAAMQGLAAFVGGRLVDRFSARALLRFYLLPLGVGVVSLGVLPPVPAMWTLFAGLGLSAGINGVACGAVWVELFGTARLGMIRGVYAALMVVSTAIGPVVLGLLLERGVELHTMGMAVGLYVLVLPPLLAPGFATPQARRAARDGKKSAPEKGH